MLRQLLMWTRKHCPSLKCGIMTNIFAVRGANLECALTPLGGGVRSGEDHSLSLEVSQDVQDGVQLQTESLQLSALVLSHPLPALHL